MRFAIRDDDTSFHTKADELESVWGRISRWAPVSLAVTPFALKPYFLGDPARFYQGPEPNELAANQELVDWLKANLEAGRASVMCHGYTHEYLRRHDGRLVQEYVWKCSSRLQLETAAGKQHLESTLGASVLTFVPPGNGISRQGLEAVRPCFRNILATFSLRRLTDFRLGREYLGNYARRLYFHLRHGAPNPFGETITGVRMIPSFSLTPEVGWETLRAHFEWRRRLGADFILAVHYWEMSAGLRDLLDRVLELAARANCKFCCCDDLFPPAGISGFEPDYGGE